MKNSANILYLCFYGYKRFSRQSTNSGHTVFIAHGSSVWALRDNDRQEKGSWTLTALTKDGQEPNWSWKLICWHWAARRRLFSSHLTSADPNLWTLAIQLRYKHTQPFFNQGDVTAFFFSICLINQTSGNLLITAMFILDLEYLYHFFKMGLVLYFHAGTFVQHLLFHLVVGNKIQRQKKIINIVRIGQYTIWYDSHGIV